jgi:hypothetical protein
MMNTSILETPEMFDSQTTAIFDLTNLTDFPKHSEQGWDSSDDSKSFVDNGYESERTAHVRKMVSEM